VSTPSAIVTSRSARHLYWSECSAIGNAPGLVGSSFTSKHVLRSHQETVSYTLCPEDFKTGAFNRVHERGGDSDFDGLTERPPSVRSVMWTANHPADTAIFPKIADLLIAKRPCEHLVQSRCTVPSRLSEQVGSHSRHVDEVEVIRQKICFMKTIDVFFSIHQEARCYFKTLLVLLRHPDKYYQLVSGREQCGQKLLKLLKLL
jgi:hypothetical protein